MEIELIRAALAKPGKTQRGLAAALGVDPAAVHRLLKGERQLKAAEIPAAARYLELESGDLGEIGRTVVVRKRHPQVVDFGAETYVMLPVYDARASAGPGIEPEETVAYHSAFREPWLRKVTRAPIDMLALLTVDGDSMEPTLRHDDSVLIDRTQTRPTAKEGIYVIRVDGGLQVKRVSAHPTRRTLSIRSDNPAYAAFDDLAPDEVHVVGRVIWLARQVAG